MLYPVTMIEVATWGFVYIILKKHKVRLSAGQPNTIRVQVDGPI